MHMRIRLLFALGYGLWLSGCLSDLGRCYGRGQRDPETGLCACPPGTQGRNCTEDAGGTVDDADGAATDGSMMSSLDAGAVEDASGDEPTTSMGTDAAASDASDTNKLDSQVDAERMDATSADASDAAENVPEAGTDASSTDAAPLNDTGTQKFWYRDCDGDGYAATRLGREQGDQKPAVTAECLDWTALDPMGASNIDCDDMNEYRHPGAGPGLPFVAGQLPAAGTLAYDLDCDGTAEPVVDFVSTGVIRAGKLEVFGFCAAEPVCPEAKKCMVFFAFPETPLCGAQYDAQVALDDVRCTQTIPIYFLCQ